MNDQSSQRGSRSPALPSGVHLEKSISFLQTEHKCALLNSSEKISFSLPQSGHLQTKELKLLKLSHPGQCAGVFMISSCETIEIHAG
jgi:hypothetical protein